MEKKKPRYFQIDKTFLVRIDPDNDEYDKVTEESIAYWLDNKIGWMWDNYNMDGVHGLGCEGREIQENETTDKIESGDWEDAIKYFEENDIAP